MSTTYEYKWDGQEAECVFQEQVNPADPVMLDLFKRVEALRKAVPLDEFKVTQTGTSPREHRYEVKTVDGRLYKNQIRVPENDRLFEANTTMTFDVSDFFTRGELAPHRLLREHIIFMIAIHKLEKIEIKLS